MMMTDVRCCDVIAKTVGANVHFHVFSVEALRLLEGQCDIFRWLIQLITGLETVVLGVGGADATSRSRHGLQTVATPVIISNQLLTTRNA